MMPDSSAPPPPSRAGLSLYANLLGSSGGAPSGTISRAPVLFAQNASSDAAQEDLAAKKQANAAALRFQPTKRPQLSAPKTKTKTPVASSTASQTEARATDNGAKQIPPPVVSLAKSTLADWTGDDNDVNGFLADTKRQRGGRKKRKKGKEEKTVIQDWDDIYDLSRPNVYDDYKNSEEQYREVREWKDRLYAHRFMKERRSSASSSDSDRGRSNINRGFAPPPEYSFAPPKDDNTTSGNLDEEDPYTRRLRMSQLNPPTQSNNTGTDDRATFQSTAPTSLLPPPPPPPAKPAEPSYMSSNPQSSYVTAQPASNTISRAPVRYQLPEAPAELPTTEAELAEAVQREVESNPDAEADAATAEDAPRSLRPGQKGFAQRLMSKYGWTKGSGLGADGSGIVNPLRVQVEKRQKKADSEGGGFVGPAGKGKIIGSKRSEAAMAAAAQEAARFGPMSEVVVLHGMVDGMDLNAELGDGGLMQEIGEECSDKYGRVERVFIDRDTAAEGSVPVFVKFTSQLSALRAVNALEGRIFNGNPIRARFFEAEKFESGVYQ